MTPAEYSAALALGGGLSWGVLATGLVVAAIMAVGVADYLEQLRVIEWQR